MCDPSTNVQRIWWAVGQALALFLVVRATGPEGLRSRAMAYGPRPADLSNLLASKRFTIIHVACPNRRIGQTKKLDYILLNSSRIIGGSHPAVADIPIGTRRTRDIVCYAFVNYNLFSHGISCSKRAIVDDRAHATWHVFYVSLPLGRCICYRPRGKLETHEDPTDATQWCRTLFRYIFCTSYTITKSRTNSPNLSNSHGAMLDVIGY